MITVRIKFDQFVNFPPYLSTYLTAIELISKGIPIDLQLTNILFPPSLREGYLSTWEDWDAQELIYTWESEDE